MSDKLICGIDIGSSKIATVVGTESAETQELRIIGFNTTVSRGVKKGLIVDIDEVIGAVEESVEKAERMAGHKINSAYVSVGGPHISSLNSHGIVAVGNPTGEIVEDDVTRVIEAARAISLSSTRQIIEVVPRDYIVDGQSGIKNPVGMSGVRLEVETHIITASATNLKNIDRVLNDLGIKNLGYIFSGLASSMAVLTPTEKELGVVLVDIGGGTCDVCVMEFGGGAGAAERLAESRILGVAGVPIAGDVLDRELIRAKVFPLLGSRSRYGPSKLPMPQNIYNSLLDWQNLYKLNTEETLNWLIAVESSSTHPEAIRMLRTFIQRNYGYPLVRKIEQAKKTLSEEWETHVEFRTESIHLQMPVDGRRTWSSARNQSIYRCL